MHPFASILCIASWVVSVVHGAPLEVRQAAAPTVTLASGIIVGTTTQYAGATATNNKFLGVPFAKSPPLRFGLPEAAAPWSSPIQATAYKPSCFQQGTNIVAANGQSEDCLYANVFSPPGTTPGSNKTVMVWIYGGDLQSGDASLDEYDGSSFAANQDVIVVTFNYRLNGFGFSNCPQIPVAEQNVGFYDQRFMLQWVQDNIDAFGGDPSQVTIFGQSAGGYSVKYLLAYPPSPLPYRAAIMESEATLVVENGTDSWDALALALGCIGSDVLACVRAADGAEIDSIINNGSLALGFPPVEDGQTFIANPNPRFASNEAAQVPILLGTNGQEASIVPELLGLNGTPLIELAEALEQFLPGLGGKLVEILNATLPNNPVSELTDIALTDLSFQCPAATLAEILETAGNPTWRYLYNASIPNIDAEQPNGGAYHTAEIPMVFGTYPRANATQFEAQLSEYMQTSWVHFAQDPTSGPGWSEYGTNQSVANIGSNGVIENTIPASAIDVLCPALEPLFGGQTFVVAIDTSSPMTEALVRVMDFDF